jgi:hypothetical protein
MTTTTRLIPFPLRSTSDVETFERHLHTYVKARTGFDSLSHFSLARVHEALLKESSGSRVFAAMVDLRISLALLEQHTIALGRLLNRSIPDEEDIALNESEASFLARMEIHDHANAFVLRFRSIWDKVMGVLVLSLSQVATKASSMRKARGRPFARYSQLTRSYPRSLSAPLKQ